MQLFACPLFDLILLDHSVQGVYVAVKGNLSLIKTLIQAYACPDSLIHTLTTSQWPKEGVRVCLLQSKKMDTKLSKSLNGSQQSAQLCNAFSTNFSNNYTHMHMHSCTVNAHTCTNTQVCTVHIFTHHKLPYTHKFADSQFRHTHTHSAFTAYYLRPITAQQSFVLLLFCQASYLTKRKQIPLSTNGWLIQIFCHV